MAELPYMPLWTDAYLSDTDHLSFEEHGIYLKLLMLIWRTPGCQLPNDEGWICRRLRVSTTQFNELVKPLMEEFLDNTGNHITSRRLQHEFDESKKRSRKQSVRAKSRWNKDKGVCHGNASPAYATDDKQDTPPPQDNPPQKKTVSSNQLKSNNKDVCRGNASISIPISILKKDTTNVVSKEKPPKKRATRIDDSWQPSGKQFAFAMEKLKTTNEVQNEIEKFKNYYQSVGGKKGLRSDWDKTFNNWIRSDYCTKPDNRSGAGDLLTAVSAASSRISSGSRLQPDRIPDDQGSQSAGQGHSHQDAGQSIRAIASEHDTPRADEAEAEDNGEEHDHRGIVITTRRLHR